MKYKAFLGAVSMALLASCSQVPDTAVTPTAQASATGVSNSEEEDLFTDLIVPAPAGFQGTNLPSLSGYPLYIYHNPDAEGESPVVELYDVNDPETSISAAIQDLNQIGVDWPRVELGSWVPIGNTGNYILTCLKGGHNCLEWGPVGRESRIILL